MSNSLGPDGATIALQCPETSENLVIGQAPVTLADLELRLASDPTKIYRTFAPTIRLLELYFTKLAAGAARASGMSEDLVVTLPPKTAANIELTEFFLVIRIRGFCPFLKAETNYTQNSRNTHVARYTTLRKHADEYGFRRDLPEQWRKLGPLARDKYCSEFFDYFASTTDSPDDVTVEAADELARELALSKVHSWCDARDRKNRFLKLLRENGFTRQQTLATARTDKIGVQPEKMPQSPIKAQTLAFRNFMIFGPAPTIGNGWDPKPWDTPTEADLKREEGKGTRRPRTAKQAIDAIALLYGFATDPKLCNLTIEYLEDLMSLNLLLSFKNWSFRVRLKTGDSIRNPLSILFANLKRWPEFRHVDLSWTDDLLDNIARTLPAEREQNKESVYLTQEELDEIPDKVKSERLREEARLGEMQANEQRLEGRRSAYRIRQAARSVSTQMLTIFALVTAEFAFRFLTTWAWRGSNLSDLRISGENPNLYKRAIPKRPPFEVPPEIAKKSNDNQGAEFWQVHLSPREHKSGRRTGKGFDAVFPDLLVDSLEELLTYREKILKHFGHLKHETPPAPLPENLLLNDSLRPMNGSCLRRLIENTAFEFGGAPMNPHLFRDAVSDYCMNNHPEKSDEVAHGLMQSSDKVMKRSYGLRHDASAGANSLNELARARQHKREKEAQTRAFNGRLVTGNGRNNAAGGEGGN